MDESMNPHPLGSSQAQLHTTTLEPSGTSSGNTTGRKRERNYDSMEASPSSSPSDEPESNYQHTPAMKRKKCAEEKHHTTTSKERKDKEKETTAQQSTSTAPPSITATPQPTNETDVTETSLHQDVLEQLLFEETFKFDQRRQLFSTLPVSFRSSDRSILGEWILDVSSALNLQKVTAHLAFKLFERFLGIVPTLSKRKYQLVCLCCLVIAIKFEEIECPSFEILNQYTGSIYTIAQIIMCETEVLNTLGWQVQEVTPAHFLNYFLEHACTRHALTLQQVQNKLNDLIYASNPLEEDELYRLIQKLSQEFIDHCLYDMALEEVYLPSEIAMASIACARKCLRFSDFFPHSLLAMHSNVRVEQVFKCIQAFESVFSRMVLQLQTNSAMLQSKLNQI